MTTFTATREQLDRAVRFRLEADGVPLTHEGFIDRLCTESRFRLWLAELLSSSEHPAFFFEMPPLTTSNLQSRSEFVLLDAPSLARSAASSSAFAEHFDGGEDVVTFTNLGGDAVLVAPCPSNADSTHLASFVRTATDAAIDHLFEAVGLAMKESVGAKPRWVSTSGLGVPWLHVRLDTRPKYYQHAPYRSVTV